jgi:hypothetical protein
LYSGRMTNQITWSKPDPPPNILHAAFTHLKAVGATLSPLGPKSGKRSLVLYGSRFAMLCLPLTLQNGDLRESKQIFEHDEPGFAT